MPELPSGTVTFLFTDIEGSTKRWESNPQQMSAALSRHDAILAAAIREQGGYVFKTVGDAFCAAFGAPTLALGAALAAQKALYTEEWPPDVGQLTVRMALHTGVVDLQDGDYFGQPVNRVARILSAGHGGQVLLSQPVYDLVRDHLPTGVSLQDLGEHRLKDLYRPERIFQLLAPDLPRQFPPLKTLDNRPNNLPPQPTPLIGREKELARIQKLLEGEDVRLLTMTGPGGTGKTRLALQAASDMIDSGVCEHGVFFVNLAPLTDSTPVASSIAQALGVKETGAQPILDTLAEYLRDRRLLLLLDHFEPLASAATVLPQILSAAPGVKMLVTSRVPLHLRAEHEYPVPPLGLPDTRAWQGQQVLPVVQLTQYEAVRLFIERARAVKPDFQVTNENAPAVAEICARLDGLPLAIELAAARSRIFSSQAILSRLSNRLKLLTGGAKDLPARQQTLRNAIEWSYDLLDEGEKQLFRRMAVFQGGRTLEALEAVCNASGDLAIDIVDGTESLVSKNLLQQREGSEGEPRFWMLETIHEYAREKLEDSGESKEFHRQHALYFMGLVEEGESAPVGREQIKWFNRMEEEHDNIRAALNWAIEEGGTDAEALEIGLRTVAVIFRFWDVRGHYTEGREQSDALLALAGFVGTGKADSQESGEFALHPHKNRSSVMALNGAGWLAHRQADCHVSPAMGEQALALASELGDKVGMGYALNLLGCVAGDEENHPLARAYFEQCLAVRRELGDKRGVAAVLHNLSGMASEEGDNQTERIFREEAMALQREIGDKHGVAGSLGAFGTMAHEDRDYLTARSLFEQSLALYTELGDKASIGLMLSWLGNVAWRMGERAEARSLYEQGVEIYKEIGDTWRIGYWYYRQGLWAFDEGRYKEAYSLFQQGLDILKGMENKRGKVISLTGLGGAAAKLGQAERGARLLGAGEAMFAAIGQVWEPDDRVPYEQGLESARSQLGEEAFEKASQEGRAMSMEQAIEYALEDWAGV